MGFNLGNAIKYIWRADLKNDAMEDLKKAAWYIDREIKRRENQNDQIFRFHTKLFQRIVMYRHGVSAFKWMPLPPSRCNTTVERNGNDACSYPTQSGCCRIETC